MPEPITTSIVGGASALVGAVFLRVAQMILDRKSPKSVAGKNRIDGTNGVNGKNGKDGHHNQDILPVCQVHFSNVRSAVEAAHHQSVAHGKKLDDLLTQQGAMGRSVATLMERTKSM